MDGSRAGRVFLTLASISTSSGPRPGATFARSTLPESKVLSAPGKPRRVPLDEIPSGLRLGEDVVSNGDLPANVGEDLPCAIDSRSGLPAPSYS
jgi:hypothetical protein